MAATKCASTLQKPFQAPDLLAKRVFDVVIEDLLALDDYDVVADAGAMFVGVMQNFEVEVTDELLTIDLLHVIENPAIKGIEIIDLNGELEAPITMLRPSLRLPTSPARWLTPSASRSAPSMPKVTA